MCGVWGLVGDITLPDGALADPGFTYQQFMKLRRRGPDYSSFETITPQCVIGFHRLAIMGVNADGNQPFHHVREDGSCVYAVCNGEIYNHRELIETYSLEVKTKSDCEVIIPLYLKFGIGETCKLLGSEFALLLFDISADGKSVYLFMARDPIGVRPLFYALSDGASGDSGVRSDALNVSSEIKALIYPNPKVFPPGCCAGWKTGPEKDSFKLFCQGYYSLPSLISVADRPQALVEIRRRLVECVRKRLQTERPFGCLLSGGLDSSLVVGIAARLLGKYFPVFTIAFKSGSTDLPFAVKVAQHLGLKHHIIEIDEADALQEIDETIYAIESYDITTVRASVMQRMIAKYIEQHSDVKVVLVGENSDELFQGYKYFHRQPSVMEGSLESFRLVQEVHLFDGLRTDRTMAYSGIEVRVPFADPELIDYVFGLDPELICPKNGVEKTLLRDAFAEDDLMPKEVLYREKEALSDGVSLKGRSWYQVIQDHLNERVTDAEFEAYNRGRGEFSRQTTPPYTKEAYYYQKVFFERFGADAFSVIPHYWMPKWSPETSDPSARTLA